MLQTKLGFPHSLALGLTHDICGQLLYAIRIHLLHYTYDGERITSYDAIRNVFASIVRDVGFHVLQEQTHIFLSPSL
jgi:hypothetical protein